MSEPDNPALFALEIRDGVVSHGTTLSLRDLFAAFALAGFASACDHEGTWTGDAPGFAAKNAYNLADAMLAEREKPE